MALMKNITIVLNMHKNQTDFFYTDLRGMFQAPVEIVNL